jgi:hypothetical protein
LASHRNLVREPSRGATSAARGTSLDAIIVPTARPADQLGQAIRLAADTSTRLVVLGSKASAVEEVAERVASKPGSRALIVHVSEDYTHEHLKHSSSSNAFYLANAQRSSDLSLKRNLGLLLVRMFGWRKIMFVDDDIAVRHTDISKLSAQLDSSQIAGMLCPRWPDNSVVCHAYRLSGKRQDVFVTGAALGVNCTDQPLPFFPDIYNEDWFFFIDRAANGELSAVGEIRQRKYNPYNDPDRARREEFGDLLAEGMYALISLGEHSSAAERPSYWQEFMDARLELIRGIVHRIGDPATHEQVQALRSMEAAEQQLLSIRPDNCVDFIAAWKQDKNNFARAAARLSSAGSCRDALDRLHLQTWRVAEFGNEAVPAIRADRVILS